MSHKRMVNVDGIYFLALVRRREVHEKDVRAYVARFVEFHIPKHTRQSSSIFPFFTKGIFSHPVLLKKLSNNLSTFFIKIAISNLL